MKKLRKSQLIIARGLERVKTFESLVILSKRKGVYD